MGFTRPSRLPKTIYVPWRIVENIYSLKFSCDDTRSCVHMRANRYELKRKGEMEFCGEKKFEKNDEGLKKEGDKEWDKYS